MSIFAQLRCPLCRWKRQQVYRIDLKPYQYGDCILLREPLYACYRCLPKYRSDPRVVRIVWLLFESEITT